MASESDCADSVGGYQYHPIERGVTPSLFNCEQMFMIPLQNVVEHTHGVWYNERTTKGGVPRVRKGKQNGSRKRRSQE